jgi:hypothetical protein
MIQTAMTRAEAAMMDMIEAAGTDDFTVAHIRFVDAVAEETARWGTRSIPAPVFYD